SPSSSYSGQVQHLVNVWTGEQEEADPNKRTLAYWMGLFMKKGGRGRQTLKIRDCRVDYPAKSRGGLYVHLEGNRNQILKGAADRLAVETANRKGWKGSGQATIGHPMQETEDRFAKAYWFHENLK